VAGAGVAGSGVVGAGVVAPLLTGGVAGVVAVVAGVSPPRMNIIKAMMTTTATRSPIMMFLFMAIPPLAFLAAERVS
jgi:3-oxoacyl-ACP reductase-like protein